MKTHLIFLTLFALNEAAKAGDVVPLGGFKARQGGRLQCVNLLDKNLGIQILNQVAGEYFAIGSFEEKPRVIKFRVLSEVPFATKPLVSADLLHLLREPFGSSRYAAFQTSVLPALKNAGLYADSIARGGLDRLVRHVSQGNFAVVGLAGQPYGSSQDLFQPNGKSLFERVLVFSPSKATPGMGENSFLVVGLTGPQKRDPIGQIEAAELLLINLYNGIPQITQIEESSVVGGILLNR